MSARPLRVVGLDISLTSTGVSDGLSAHAVQTGPDDLLEARMNHIVQGVMDFIHSPTQWTDSFRHAQCADLAVIEAGAFSRGSQSQAAEILSALRMMVRVRLWKRGVPFAMVAPTTLKLYTTGHGNATKQQMVAALDERHGTGFASVKVKDGRYDQADAFALADMGYDRVGQPLAMDHPSPEPHRDSLNAVRWPELVSDD